MRRIIFFSLSLILIVLIAMGLTFYLSQKHFKLKLLEIETENLKKIESLRHELELTKKELRKAQKIIELSQYYTFLSRTCGYEYEVSVPLVKTVIECLDRDNPYGYTYSEILSLILIESGFNSKVVSKAGAIGLMQIMPSTAKEFGVENEAMLFNPMKNIELGIKILNKYTEISGGDKMIGLLKYNRGPKRVEQLMQQGKDPYNLYPYQVKTTG